MAAPNAPTRETLLEIARSLPPAAPIMAGLHELLHDVNTDLDQIADQIRKDAALSARVIRISNSLVYGGGGSVSTVEEAVGRVGFSEIVRLVGAATVARLADRDLKYYQIGADELREALLMHALAAEALGALVGLDRDATYVGGLLRGIGTMVLDRYATATLAPHEAYDLTKFDTYSAWEMARFNVTSVEVTTTAMDEWNFPSDLVTAIELHLDPPTDDNDVAKLSTVINLAGAIAVEHGHALPGEVKHWSVTPEKLATLHLDETHFRTAVEQASKMFDRQRESLY